MWLQLTALSWLIYRLTDSAAWVGVLTFALQGPGLVLGPIAGALADRHDKRRILVIAQATSMFPALFLGLLTLGGAIRPWQIVGLAVFTGVAQAFEIPTRQAFFRELVGREDLPNAIALNSALFNVARMVGPAIAGVLIPLVGEGWCFLINSGSYLAVVAALLAVRTPKHVRSRSPGSSLLREIGEGISYVRAHPAMLGLLGALAVAAGTGMPYSVLLPSFASRVLQGGPETFSYLQIAVALGALSGAFALATRARVLGLERWVVGAGVSFGFWLVAVSLTKSTLLAVALLVPTGFSFMVQMATTNTLLQTLTPDRLRGRVMSLHTSAFLGIFPVAGLIAGALADRFGEAAVLSGGGIAVALSAVLFGRLTLRTAPAALETAVAESSTEQ
jgi:MFS family permease